MQFAGEGEEEAGMSDEKIQAFLDELTELSHKHGLAINPDGDLFELEPDDTERKYHCDEDSKVDFY